YERLRINQTPRNEHQSTYTQGEGGKLNGDVATLVRVVTQSVVARQCLLDAHNGLGEQGRCSIQREQLLGSMVLEP
ncbi:hypothetical protein OFN51_39060, partial [Escherichia coli]|nr:hypothetical protein [Escherichia coli]